MLQYDSDSRYLIFYCLLNVMTQIYLLVCFNLVQYQKIEVDSAQVHGGLVIKVFKAVAPGGMLTTLVLGGYMLGFQSLGHGFESRLWLHSLGPVFDSCFNDPSLIALVASCLLRIRSLLV